LLMSATPMYNEDDEITTLLNILRINDGRCPIPKQRIFGTNGITEEGEFILKNSCRG